MMPALAWLGSALAATFTVTTTSDVVNPADGVLSLREALLVAANGDTIAFSMAIFPSGVVTPLLVTQGTLVAGTVGVTIDGDGRVKLSGSSAPAGTSGLEVTASSVTVKSLQVGSFPAFGIFVSGGSGQHIGVTGAGNDVRANGSDGIRVGSGSPVQDTAVTDNLVSGNCTTPTGTCGGITILGTGTLTNVIVQDNLVTATQGDPAQLQGTGILVGFGSGHLLAGNTVGGPGTEGNLGSGIVVASAGSLITGVQIEDDTIGGNARNGILLATGARGVLVEGNRVGTDATGSVAVPNGTNGVYVFGSNWHTLRNNTISGNALSGIVLAGNTQGNHAITGNLIGVDSAGTAALPNAEYGIWSAGLLGATTIGGDQPGDGNVISGNGKSGVRLEDDGHVVQGNRIGTDVTGMLPLPNGTASGGPWPGIDVYGTAGIGGDSSWEGLPALGALNQVSGNAGPGIRLGPGSDGTTVAGNLVGLDATGMGALGNAEGGIVVDGATNAVIGTTESTNLVSGNLGAGIRVASALGPTSAATIEHNGVGLGIDGSTIGNGGHGIELDLLDDAVVSDNTVVGSGAVGIWVMSGEVKLTANRVSRSGACAVRVTGGTGSTFAPPEVLGANSTTIHGTLSIPAGQTVERVDVFWDDEDEAREYLGIATVVGNAWVLDRLGKQDPLPVRGRVVATTTVSPAEVTSGIAAGCNDGCGAPGTGECIDGNPCTFDICTVSGCQNPVENGIACSDGDGCTQNDICSGGVCTAGAPVANCASADHCRETDATGVIVKRDCSDGDVCGTVDWCDTDTGTCEHGDAPSCDDRNWALDAGQIVKAPFDCTNDSCVAPYGCEHPFAPAGFACHADACSGRGSCDPTGGCIHSDPVACPFEDAHMVGTCDPVSGCSYEGLPDGYCSSAELCDDPFGDCEATLGAGAPPWHTTGLGGTDFDGDGVPDVWENLGGPDLDGDGIKDFDLPGHDSAVRNVWVELDYMAADDHDETPWDDVENDDQNTYLQTGDGKDPTESVILTVDVNPVTLPHHEILDWGSPDDPACADWVSIYDYKSDPTWFDPRKRGFYHFSVRGHSGCGGDGGGGVGEIYGDDTMQFVTQPDGSGGWSDGPGSLFHELGHNLGLHHGGFDDLLGKPEFQSSMNYRYGGDLVPYNPGNPDADGPAVRDYSRELVPDLDETNLDETVGIQSAFPKYWVNHPCDNPETGIHKWEPDGPIDWNCDGVIGAGVHADLDKDGRKDDILESRDDWATLRFDFYCGSPNDWDDLPGSPQPADQETYVPRSDLDPACPVGLLPVAGGGEVQLVIYGSSTFDVNRIETDTNTGERVITLSYATPPVATAIEDVDGDTWPDMVASFDASAIEVDPARGYMYWGSRLDAGGRDDPEVLGQVLFSAVPSPVDADGDGVDDRNGCDRCPSQTAPDPSADGCP